MTLKYEGFHVGQSIRAWDFEPMPDRKDRYVEGTIVAVNLNGTPTHAYGHYVIRCARARVP